MKDKQEIGLNDCNGVPIRIGDTLKAFDHPTKSYIGKVEWNTNYLCVAIRRGQTVHDWMTMGSREKYEVLNEELPDL